MQGHEVRNCLVHVDGNVTPFTVVTVNDVDAAYLVPSLIWGPPAAELFRGRGWNVKRKGAVSGEAVPEHKTNGACQDRFSRFGCAWQVRVR